jgi:hypothetical protein
LHLTWTPVSEHRKSVVHALPAFEQVSREECKRLLDVAAAEQNLCTHSLHAVGLPVEVLTVPRGAKRGQVYPSTCGTRRCCEHCHSDRQSHYPGLHRLETPPPRSQPQRSEER